MTVTRSSESRPATVRLFVLCMCYSRGKRKLAMSASLTYVKVKGGGWCSTFHAPFPPSVDTFSHVLSGHCPPGMFASCLLAPDSPKHLPYLSRTHKRATACISNAVRSFTTYPSITASAPGFTFSFASSTLLVCICHPMICPHPSPVPRQATSCCVALHVTSRRPMSPHVMPCQVTHEPFPRPFSMSPAGDAVRVIRQRSRGREQTVQHERGARGMESTAGGEGVGRACRRGRGMRCDNCFLVEPRSGSV